MDQVKIGKFISEVRKQRGMTQKELAESIGISDKTISKWECGNSIPDIGYLEPLCASLEISVNELLSGQRLSEASYSHKAEENIMELMKENENNKKGGFWNIILGVILSCLTFILLIFVSQENLRFLRNYFDFITLLMMVMLCLAGVLLSGKKSKQDIVRVLHKLVIPSGVLICLFQLVILLGQLNDASTIGPNIAVCVLAIIYSVVAYLILTIIKERKAI